MPGALYSSRLVLGARGVRGIAYALYLVAILGLVTAKGIVGRKYGWDVLAYAGVALSYESDDPARIHAGVYGALAQAATPKAVLELTTGSSYRAEVARDPEAFHEQLRFYSARIGFTALVYGLHALGMNVVRAPFVLSAAAYVATALLLLRWTGRYLAPAFAALVSFLVCLSHPVLGTGCGGTPDMPVALLTVAAFYVLLEREMPRLSLAILTFATLFRYDVVVVGLALAGYLLLTGPAPPRERARRFGPPAAALAAAAALVARGSHGYSWGILFQHTFGEELAHPASASAAVSARDYVRVVLDSLRLEVASNVFVVYLLVLAIGVAAHLDRRRAAGDAAGEAARTSVASAPLLGAAGVLLAGAAARWLVFPAFWDRFFVAHEVIFAVLAVRMVQDRRAPLAGS